MKKKKVIWGIVAVVAGLVIAGSMGSDEPASKSTPTVKEEVTAEEEVPIEEEEQTSESEIVEEIQEPEAGESASANEPDDYFEVGETFNNGEMRVTALDIGFYDNPGSDMYGTHYMYVLTEIENISEEVQTVRQATDIYIDDYQYPPSHVLPIVVDSITGDSSWVDLNPGRKCKYLFYSSIPEDAFDADRVEFVIYGSIPVLFKNEGNWINDSDAVADATASSATGIGNPIIDANPDRYVLVDGRIDGIDDGFYADSGNIDLVSGEYYITGGASAILTITENTISMSGGKNNFENAEIKLAGNGAPQYWVYVDDDYCYAIVSFFDGGLYFRTLEEDGEEDWDEGFYSKF